MLKVSPIQFVLRSFKRKEYSVEFFLTRRCNLNCKNCSRFAPFYDKTSDVSFEEFKEDFDIVSEFSDFKNIKRINLSGGEATIVKDFIKIVEYTRSKFKGIIQVCSNGAKIQGFSNTELEILKRAEAHFVITKYPNSNINYEKVFQILDQFEITREGFKDFGKFESDRYFFNNQYIISKKLKPIFRHRGECCSSFPSFYKGKVHFCDKNIEKYRDFGGVSLKEFKSFKEIIRYLINDHSKNYFCERCLKEFRRSSWEVDKSNSIDFYLLSKKDEEYYCE